MPIKIIRLTTVAIIIIIAALFAVWNFGLLENKKEAVPAKTALPRLPGYSGELVAGKTTPYLRFNQSDYEKALKEKKIIMLVFTATWCSLCRVEQPKIEALFNDLDDTSLIGFKVHIKDEKSEDSEKEVAKKFDVSYPDTKLFLVNGKEALRDIHMWDTPQYIEAIKNLTN